MINALIYRDVKNVKVEKRPIPQCGPNDVIVRTVRAGICGSDTTAYLHGGDVEVNENAVLDVDVVFDCVGIPEFIDAFVRHAKQYARLCNIAVHRAVTPVRFHEIMSTQCALMGSRGYEKKDIEEVISYLSSGRSKAHLMVTHCFNLEQAEKAFETAVEADKAIKVILNME